MVVNTLLIKGASFSIHILEKLEGDAFIDSQRDFAVQKLRLQREGYWLKKLRTIYPYDLNERAKNSNLEKPTSKLFPPFPRFSNRHENLEKRLVNEPTKFDSNISSKKTGVTIFVESQKELREKI